MSDIQAKGVTGTVTFDGRFVTISRSGGIGAVTAGRGEKRIPVGNVTAVQWRAPSLAARGYIQFTIPGGSEVRGRGGSSVRDAAKDENSVLFKRSQQEAFEELRRAVEAAI